MSQWQYSNYSKISSEAKKYFPFTQPRQHQLETISEIKEAIDEGYRYIVLEAGTGTGKSAIAATLTQMFDSSYILTVTKQLQDQYLNDFNDLGFKLVKGRGNFRCRKYLEDGIKQSCDLGMCRLEGHKCKYSLKNHPDNEITKENTCEYFFQKFQGLTSPTTIANYPYMFLELNYVEDFTKRTLMICDEAHNIENVIMSQLTLEFERSDLKQYLKFNLSKDQINQLTAGDYTDWINFVTKIKNKYEKELKKIENVEKLGLFEKKIFIKNMIDECRRFLDNLQFDPRMWIFDWDKKYGIAQFKPLKVDNYAKNTLFKYADVCLFMSATVLDYKLFTNWLGIRPDEIYAIRRKSPFDVKRNPIKTYNQFNMSLNHLEKSAPKTIDTVESILENHKNEKGIIHTVSGKCRDFLIKNIKTDRFIFHDTQNRAEIIEEFKSSSKPLVLVSPSVGEGVDLPGDECRFQIIYKMPYLDLADRQTSMRSAFDSRWYDYKTALNLVQTHGRGMRFEDDYCTTYFIDSRLIGFVKEDSLSNFFIPDTFKKAIDKLSDEKSKSKIIVDEDSLDFKRKVNLIEKGNRLFNQNIPEAIKFYQGLLSNELFVNDFYPYQKLAQSYSEALMFEKETEIIVLFFKSGIYAEDVILDDFKNRLKILDAKGYFDYASEIISLENEFYVNGARNRAISDTPVPKSVKIIEMMESHLDELKKEKEKDIFKELDKFCQRTFRLK